MLFKCGGTSVPKLGALQPCIGDLDERFFRVAWRANRDAAQKGAKEIDWVQKILSGGALHGFMISFYSHPGYPCHLGLETMRIRLVETNCTP